MSVQSAVSMAAVEAWEKWAAITNTTAFWFVMSLFGGVAVLKGVILGFHNPPWVTVGAEIASILFTIRYWRKR